MRWQLRQRAVERGITSSAEVRRRLAAAGLRISVGKMSALWSTTPVSVRLDDLEVICAVLACEPSDLLTCQIPAPAAPSAHTLPAPGPGVAPPHKPPVPAPDSALAGVSAQCPGPPPRPAPASTVSAGAAAGRGGPLRRPVPPL
ncbi:helix-turn-helix domain-containing protein [Streptomyces sp. NPDC001759]